MDLPFASSIAIHCISMTMWKHCITLLAVYCCLFASKGGVTYLERFGRILSPPFTVPLHRRTWVESIEYVRGGHVGGENKNIFAWELNFFPKENSFIVLLLQHGHRAHTLFFEWLQRRSIFSPENRTVPLSNLSSERLSESHFFSTSQSKIHPNGPGLALEEN